MKRFNSFQSSYLLENPSYMDEGWKEFVDKAQSWIDPISTGMQVAGGLMSMSGALAPVGVPLLLAGSGLKTGSAIADIAQGDYEEAQGRALGGLLGAAGAGMGQGAKAFPTVGKMFGRRAAGAAAGEATAAETAAAAAAPKFAPKVHSPFHGSKYTYGPKGGAPINVRVQMPPKPTAGAAPEAPIKIDVPEIKGVSDAALRQWYERTAGKAASGEISQAALKQWYTRTAGTREQARRIASAGRRAEAPAPIGIPSTPAGKASIPSTATKPEEMFVFGLPKPDVAATEKAIGRAREVFARPTDVPASPLVAAFETGAPVVGRHLGNVSRAQSLARPVGTPTPAATPSAAKPREQMMLWRDVSGPVGLGTKPVTASSTPKATTPASPASAAKPVGTPAPAATPAPTAKAATPPKTGKAAKAATPPPKTGNSEKISPATTPEEMELAFGIKATPAAPPPPAAQPIPATPPSPATGSGLGKARPKARPAGGTPSAVQRSMFEQTDYSYLNQALDEGFMDWVKSNTDVIDKFQDYADYASIATSFIPVPGANLIGTGLQAASAVVDAIQGQRTSAAVRGGLALANATGVGGVAGIAARGTGRVAKAVYKAASPGMVKTAAGTVARYAPRYGRALGKAQSAGYRGLGKVAAFAAGPIAYGLADRAIDAAMGAGAGGDGGPELGGGRSVGSLAGAGLFQGSRDIKSHEFRRQPALAF